MIECNQLTRTYTSGGRALTVLKDITLRIDAGAFTAIVGPSGSGKTTLLGLLAGLDAPTSGTVSLDGQRLDQLDEDGRARLRAERVGFVFQSFQLIPTLTALENVLVPLELTGDPDVARALGLLSDVGLSGREHHYPSQLSGGEQQRVALARAFVNQPAVLFADEPTGNLDAAIGEKIAHTLVSYTREQRAVVIIATHSPVLAGMCDRLLVLEDGRCKSV